MNTQPRHVREVDTALWSRQRVDSTVTVYVKPAPMSSIIQAPLDGTHGDPELSTGSIWASAVSRRVDLGGLQSASQTRPDAHT